MNVLNTEKLVGQPKSLWYHSLLVIAIIGIGIIGFLCISGCAFKVQLQEYTPEMLEDMRSQNIRSYRQGGRDTYEEYEAYLKEMIEELR